MNTQRISRFALYSFAEGVAAAIIYLIIALATGQHLNSPSIISTVLIVGVITFVVAFILYNVFTYVFSQRTTKG